MMPEAPSYEIVPYAPGLKPQIVELQTRLWGSDLARNAAYLKWKFEDNPYLDRPVMLLARSGERIVGMRGFFGTRWRVGEGVEHLLPAADDLVVAPEHRNRGLVGRIMHAAFEELAARGYPFTINLSGSPITLVGSLAMGWRSAGSAQPTLVRTRSRVAAERLRGWCRRSPLVWRVAGSLRTPGEREPFRRLDRAEPSAGGPVRLSHEAWPESMAELLARIPRDGRIRHVRDARYFSWRFRNPLHEYRFLFWQEDRLEGYLVLCRSRSDLADAARVHVVDWQAVDDRIRDGLLDASVRWGRFPEIGTWTATLPDTSRRLLERHGFRPSTRTTIRTHHLLLRRLGTPQAPESWELGGLSPLDLRNWDLQMLDSMAP